MKITTNLKKAFVLVSFPLLTFCGSESADNNEAPQNTVSSGIAAYNKLTAAPLNTLTTVDLNTYISGQGVSVSEIFSDTPEKCFAQIEEDGSQSVNVEIYELGRCHYTYVAKDELGKKATANLTLIASTQAEPVLPTISKNLSLSNTATVNLTDFFADKVTDYSITDSWKTSIFDEVGAESLSELSDDRALTLSFKAPNTIGWHVINYELMRDEDTLVGELFVSVTNGKNEAPEINKPNFIYTGGSVGTQTGDSVSVDLSQITCHSHYLTFNKDECLTITDDNNQWQLSNVKSMSANVETTTVGATKPDETNNTSFTLETSVTGFHDVSYVVTDIEGASSIGTMRIYAEDEEIEFGKKWKPQTIDVNILTGVSTDDLDKIKWFVTGTYTHIQAISEANNYNYHPEKVPVNTGKPHLIALWDQTEANSFCENVSNTRNLRLPTSKNLEDVKIAIDSENNALPENEKLYWPNEKYYYVKNSEGLQVYDWNQGITKDLSDPDVGEDYKGYVTCLECESNNWWQDFLCWAAKII